MTQPIRRDDVRHADLSDVTTGDLLPNVAPGEVLRHEFMAPLGLSARALARDLNIPANRITGILNGERAITADTALRLAGRFRTSAEFWMNLQTSFDLEAARRRRSALPDCERAKAAAAGRS